MTTCIVVLLSIPSKNNKDKHDGKNVFRMEQSAGEVIKTQKGKSDESESVLSAIDNQDIYTEVDSEENKDFKEENQSGKEVGTEQNTQIETSASYEMNKLEDTYDYGQAQLDQQREESMEVAKEAVNIKNPSLEISASNAILVNITKNKVLYSKEPLKKISPASTTKLLTAIIAIESCDDSFEFHVGDEIDLMASDASRAYLKKGEVLILDSMLDALLLPSGNDAAYVIATNVGRFLAKDSLLDMEKANEVFIQAMNDKARSLGAVDSNFRTPDGYDEQGQYTTAYDLALIAKEALTHEKICASVKKEKARNILISGEDVTWYNTNKLVKNGSGYYYSYAIGLKTGTSTEAGRCLVSAAKKEDQTYVSVIMDASPEGRWKDSIQLLKYGIEG